MEHFGLLGAERSRVSIVNFERVDKMWPGVFISALITKLDKDFFSRNASMCI